jgi:large subunit ribosomal protein L6
MSRIGRLPIHIPDGVKLHIADDTVRVEGPKATLSRRLEPEVTIAIEGNTALVRRRDDSRRARSVHGLMRKLVANMVQGAGAGFTKVLEITGVGYRAEARGQVLYLTLGYSHPIAYQLPPGITARRPPRFASSGRRSRTRGRASNTARKPFAERPARRQREGADVGNGQGSA